MGALRASTATVITASASTASDPQATESATDRRDPRVLKEAFTKPSHISTSQVHQLLYICCLGFSITAKKKQSFEVHSVSSTLIKQT